MSLSLFFFSSSLPAWQEWPSYTDERRGAEALPSPSWAPVQARGEERCELHSSQQWQAACSYGYVRRTVWACSQLLPRELCAQNLIQNAKSAACSTRFVSQAHLTSSVISLFLLMLPFPRTVPTPVKVCPHFNSHIKSHSQADAQNMSKLRKMVPRGSSQVFRKGSGEEVSWK